MSYQNRQNWLFILLLLFLACVALVLNQVLFRPDDQSGAEYFWGVIGLIDLGVFLLLVRGGMNS
ncbi:hypothetical protein [Maricaulis maris]|uniref:hypothetical protein n=1 Tax=Maricaulis maris TaxID=74318 RepID=UPI003A90B48B